MSQCRARLARRSALAAALATAATAALLPTGAGALGPSQQRTGQGTYDVRAGVAADDPSAPGAAADALTRELGPAGVVAIDPVNGTPRQLLRTDGTLTGRSASAPATVALDYVQAHSGVFGLTGGELSALGAPRTTVSPAGVRQLRWTQHYGGIPVLGAGLRAAVARDGRLIALGGAPLPDAAVPSTEPRLTAADALARVRRDAGAGSARPAAGAGAPPAPKLVIFAAHDGPRLAWQVRVDADSTHRYSYVLDAGSGAILKRANLVRFADSGIAGDDDGGGGGAWAYAPSGGPQPNPRFGSGRDGEPAWRPVVRRFPEGWITSGGMRLKGVNAHVYSDVDDDDAPGLAEEVRRNGRDHGVPVWDYPLRTVSPGWGFCPAAYPCSWRDLSDQTGDGGWNENREQNAVQVFWFLNRYKEHLAEAPIGFDSASGNFSGDDYVIGNTDDGADKSYVDDQDVVHEHHPDSDHLNNANMFTPPDGESPRMQMYLFMPGLDLTTDPTIDANGGDDASIVYHEYTHGLSSRLITYDDGEQALNAPQAGAMGEAWSDFYAMDFLAAEGDQRDTATDGEVLLASYISRGQPGALREAAMDCPPGESSAPECAGGGFTYADYGRVIGDYGPEVHADGEIWGQTLWDLRTALIRAGVEEAHSPGGGSEQDGIAQGQYTTRLLVTEAMRLAPEEPSFLDMRDAILAANAADPDVDEAARAFHRQLIWEIFAARGMGYYAATLDASDPAPIADFHLPPRADTPTATLRGTVTDADTGAPLAGARVWLPSWPGVVGPSAETGADGAYAIDGALAGIAYPRLLVERNGYSKTTQTDVTVAVDGSSVLNLRLRRNWALRSGLASVERFSGPDLTGPGCGPEGAIDGTSAYGWGSYQPGYDGSQHAGLPLVRTGSRELVLRLLAAVDVSSFEVDPGAVCGDDDSASLGGYQLHTSTDGVTWRLAATGTFSRAHNHRLTTIPLYAGTGAGVRYVRMTMLSPQGGAGASDNWFMDMAELGVYGPPTSAVDPPDPPDPPDPGDPAPGDPEPGDPPAGDPPVHQPDPVTPPARPAPQQRAPTADTDPKLSKVAVPLPKRRSLRTVLSRAGVPLRLRSDERVRVIATVTLPAATARRLRMAKQRRGTVAIGRLSGARVAANRTTTLRVRLPRNTRIWLDRARLRSLTFGVAILATDAGGNITAKTLTATARR